MTGVPNLHSVFLDGRTQMLTKHYGIIVLVDGSPACGTPTTIPSVHRIPIVGPNTPARSQFNVEDTEPASGSAARNGVRRDRNRRRQKRWATGKLARRASPPTL